MAQKLANVENQLTTFALEKVLRAIVCKDRLLGTEGAKIVSQVAKRALRGSKIKNLLLVSNYDYIRPKIGKY